MSEFNFKSQPCTSREQSERLLVLGLKKETADCIHYYFRERGWRVLVLEKGQTAKHIDGVEIPAWSLGRLLELSYGDVHPNNVLRLSAHNPFEDIIKTIDEFIKHQCFNKEYLV